MTWLVRHSTGEDVINRLKRSAIEATVGSLLSIIGLKPFLFVQITHSTQLSHIAMSPRNTGERHGRVPKGTKGTADPSPPGSGRHNDQSSRRSQDDGASVTWEPQQRLRGYRETLYPRSRGGTKGIDGPRRPQL